ncbi:GGDEF domain-containing phosphodiesterase [Oscillospiraceae bacterium PP1C4]
MINYITLTLIILLLSIMLFLIYIILRQRKDINYDNLTNLISYYTFLNQAECLLNKAKPREYTLFLIDIDDFKYLNQLLGTETANIILTILSNYLTDFMKAKGITDYLFTRKFADKFILLCRTKDISSQNIVPLQNEKELSSMIKSKVKINIELRYSIGQVIIDDPRKSLLLLIGEAHLANEQCKSYYNTHLETLSTDTVNRFLIEKNILYRMNQHLLDDSLEIYLQPKYDLKSGNIVGAEALVRWIEDGEVIYNPEQFIPLFEKYYFIKELDLFMFKQVCKTLKELEEKSKDSILISVNMSRITLMQENIAGILLDILNSYGLSPNKIEIEITESALTGDSEEVARQVQQLKSAGFELSLDDFGAGQSTLTSLIFFDIDIIKLDKEFLSTSSNESAMCIMIKHLIQLMHAFDLKVVAEGVETKEDVDMLRTCGCDIAQGYYFSKPVPKDMFYRLI